MIQELLLDDNIDKYRRLYDKAKFKTIYHDPDYLIAEEAAEKYPLYFYLYEKSGKFAVLINVKRKLNDIDFLSDLKEEYYDMISPHEYSGVMAYDYDIELFKDMYIEFESFCRQNNVIFHFIRFNPYSDEYKAAEGWNCILSGEHVWINCNEEHIETKFSKSKRRDLRRAVRFNLKCEKVEKNKKNREIFESIYNLSMDRLHAKKFLYFNDDYFTKLLKSEFVELYFVEEPVSGKIASASIVMYDYNTKIVYYHLSCRVDEFRHMQPVELLIYIFASDAQKKNFKKVHLAGGGQSLLNFKVNFSDKRVDYYIAYNIFNKEIYHLCCDKFIKRYPNMKDNGFLPLYRAME